MEEISQCLLFRHCRHRCLHCSLCRHCLCQQTCFIVWHAITYVVYSVAVNIRIICVQHTVFVQVIGWVRVVYVVFRSIVTQWFPCQAYKLS